ncbi:MAG: 50S ribosomal protein L15 [Bacteroidales bacterium]|nr:50S ribosomal protein L15 [Bacteroidales bacterium]MDE7072100.1 50S ribosomal protein L15 [Bacteroidales bacterium]
MDLSVLTPAKGSVRTNKRKGRGYGSGNGQTAGRGHKGAQSRSGYSRKIGFEGGQMPLYRRLPKTGFKNANRIEYNAINLDTIEKIASEKGLKEINLQVLVDCGLAAKRDKIKILGRGELKSTVSVTANAFSAKAKEAIEAKGGSVVLTEQQPQA